MSSDLAYSLNKFERALKRLEESYALPQNDIVRDSCAKRFEFFVVLAWKTLKIFLREKHGMMVPSPKSCIREAYRLKVIDYEITWLKMID